MQTEKRSTINISTEHVRKIRRYADKNGLKRQRAAERVIDAGIKKLNEEKNSENR